VAVDELAAFMGIEGDCEDCADELAGSEGCDAIVVGDAGVLFTAGCSFARLRGPISAGAEVRRCSTRRGELHFAPCRRRLLPVVVRRRCS
jgi:hypothetical protein